MKNWDTIKQINTDNYDLLIFNEIWQIRDFELVLIDGFKISCIYQRRDQRGGGVMIFIRETIKFESIESICEQGIIETTSIKINNTIITALYRPPSGNKQRFVELLIEWTINQRERRILIAGDFNINYLNQDRAYFDKIENETGLSPCIKALTRLSSNTCIDNVITNINGRHTISNICIADHQGIDSKIKLNIVKTQPKKYKYREMSERNWNSFSNGLNHLRIRGQNVNDKWSNLCNDMKSLVESSFQEKSSKSPHKFSMSQGLLKSKNKKNKLLKKYQRGEIEKEVYMLRVPQYS